VDTAGRFDELADKLVNLAVCPGKAKFHFGASYLHVFKTAGIRAL
jgi:hypothetical protein